MISDVRLREKPFEYPSKKSPVSENPVPFSDPESNAPQTKEGDISGGNFKCTFSTSDGNNGVLYMGKDILASVGGIGGTVNVKYHESSTQDDPVVMIWGMDAQGKEYENTVHLNDIDINHATPAEMIALNAHLTKIGDKSVAAADPGALWISFGTGNDVNSKMDFGQYFKDYIAMQELGNNKSGAALYQCQLERYIFFTKHN